jgi:hypothetical protein
MYPSTLGCRDTAILTMILKMFVGLHDFKIFLLLVFYLMSWRDKAYVKYAAASFY